MDTCIILLTNVYLRHISIIDSNTGWYKMNLIYYIFYLLLFVASVHSMEDSVARNPSDEIVHRNEKHVDPLLSEQHVPSEISSMPIPARISDIDAAITGVSRKIKFLEEKTSPIFKKSVEKHKDWLNELRELREKALGDPLLDVRSQLLSIHKAYDPGIFAPR